MTLWTVLSQPDDSSTSQTDDSSNTITIGKQLVMQAASPEFMLHQLIGCYGFHGDTIDGIIESMNSQDGGIGKIWKSNEYMLCIDREKLLITPQKEMDNLQKERAFRLPEEAKLESCRKHENQDPLLPSHSRLYAKQGKPSHHPGCRSG